MRTERGTVALGLGAGPLLFQPAGNSHVQYVVERRGPPRFDSAKDPFQLQLEDFAEACVSGRPPLVTARDGLRSVVLLSRLYAAQRPLPRAFTPLWRGPAQEAA
jgi:predicted dehydrogenase